VIVISETKSFHTSRTARTILCQRCLLAFMPNKLNSAFSATLCRVKIELKLYKNSTYSFTNCA